MSTYRPAVQLIADSPFKSGWQAVSPTAQAGFVSVNFGDKDNGVSFGMGRTDPSVVFSDLEFVRCIGAVMVATTMPRTVPDEKLSSWIVDSTTNWRQVQTDMTREAWLKWCAATQVVATSRKLYWMEPGIKMRAVFYAPEPGAAGADQMAYFDLAVVGVAKLRFPILRSNAPAPGSPSSQVQSKPVAVDDLGNVLSYYDGGWDGTRGLPVAFDLRMVRGKDTWLVANVGGMSQEWSIKLPASTYARQQRLTLGYRGGQWAFNVAQLQYLDRGGIDWRGPGPKRYQQCGEAGPEEQMIHFWLPPGMNATSYAAAAFDGTDLLGGSNESPKVTGLSRWCEPYTMESETNPVTLAGCQKLRLSMAGRTHHTCSLTWRDKDPAATAAFVRNGVVTVKAGLEGTTLTTLFVGRAGGPASRSKDGPLAEQPTFTLFGDAERLQKQPMITMPGAWSFLPFKDAFNRLLLAAGVPLSRQITLDDLATSPPILLPSEGLELQFGPETSVARALDAICTARGCVWWCDRFGVYHAASRRELAAPADHELDIHSTAFLGFVPSIGHEVTADGDFANAVCVESPTGHSAVYAPLDRALADGGTWWRYVRRETATPGLVAKQVYDELSGAKQTVTWQEWWDPTDWVQPEAVVSVAAETDPAIGLTLAEGQLLRVTDTVLTLDFADQIPKGIVQYTATVGDA